MRVRPLTRANAPTSLLVPWWGPALWQAAPSIRSGRLRTRVIRLQEAPGYQRGICSGSTRLCDSRCYASSVLFDASNSTIACRISAVDNCAIANVHSSIICALRRALFSSSAVAAIPSIGHDGTLSIKVCILATVSSPSGSWARDREQNSSARTRRIVGRNVRNVSTKIPSCCADGNRNAHLINPYFVGDPPTPRFYPLPSRLPTSVRPTPLRRQATGEQQRGGFSDRKNNNSRSNE